MKPVTRLETLVQAIIEGSDLPFSAVDRIEMFLSDIISGQVSSIAPVTRLETYLAKISGQGIDIPTPITRIECFLAAIAGMNVNLPTTVTRLEMLLNVWADSAASHTLSGPIVSFLGKSSTEILGLSVALAPIQDLHGYDAPWPAGGGTNIYNYDNVVASYIDQGNNGAYRESSGYSRSVWMLLDAGTWTIQKALSSVFRVAGYSGDSFPVQWQQPIWFENVSSSETHYTFTITSKQYVVAFIVNSSSASDIENSEAILASVKFNAGPLANICPITGWTGANVTRTGKNLGEFENGYNIVADGSIGVNAKRCATVNPIKIFNGISYVFTSETGLQCIYAVFNGNTLVRRTSGIASGSTLDTSGGTDLYVCAYGSSDYTATVETDKPMVRSSLSSSDYEPYQGATYSVDWTSTAGTVYRGTLDVTSGKLTVTHWGFDMGDIDYTESSTYAKRFAGFFPSNKGFPEWTNTGAPSGKLICSIYKERSYNDVWAGGQNAICVYRSGDGIMKFGACEPSCAGAAAFKQFVTGQTVVYELATPIEYTLTPQDVTALVGQNYVWSDAGDVSVTVKNIVPQ